MSILLNISIGSDAAGPALWVTIVTALGSAVIGALVTIWAKRTEFKNFRDSLNLQRELFKETKQNNENQIKAELVRLKSLRKEYELNLKRHDFDRLAKILEFADDKDEKAQMMKQLAKVASKLRSPTPDHIVDYEDFMSHVAWDTYSSLKRIPDELERLLVNFPNVFTSIHPEIKKVMSSAESIRRHVYEMDGYGADSMTIVGQLTKELVELDQEFAGLLDLMKSEFKDMESIRKDFIKSQVDKSKP